MSHVCDRIMYVYASARCVLLSFQIVQPLFDTHSAEFQGHVFSSERQLSFFRMCAGLIWSRALPLPISGPHAAEPALMPLVDLFNGRYDELK